MPFRAEVSPLEALAPAHNSRTAQGDRALEHGDLSGIRRFDEEVGRGEGTHNSGEEPGPETAQARGSQDGREEGSSQKHVQPNRLEGQV